MTSLYREGHDLNVELEIIKNSLRNNILFDVYKKVRKIILEFNNYDMRREYLREYLPENLPENFNKKYIPSLDYYAVCTNFLVRNYNGIVYKNNLIKEIITLLTKNNNIKFNTVVIHDGYEINFATIIVIMLLYVYQENIFCLRALNYKIKIQDIHNTIELKLLTEAGIFNIVNVDAILKMSKKEYIKMTCLMEMLIFVNDYCGGYKNELNNILKIIPNSITNLIYFYLFNR